MYTHVLQRGAVWFLFSIIGFLLFSLHGGEKPGFVLSVYAAPPTITSCALTPNPTPEDEWGTWTLTYESALPLLDREWDYPGWDTLSLRCSHQDVPGELGQRMINCERDGEYDGPEVRLENADGWSSMYTCPLGTVSPPPPPKPDLISSALAISGATELLQNNPENFRARVINDGEGSATSSFSNYFYYRYNTASPWTIFSGPHTRSSGSKYLNSSDTSSNHPLDTAGTIHIRHCVDADGEIVESNEDNNCTEASYEVPSETAPRGDLTVSGFGERDSGSRVGLTWDSENATACTVTPGGFTGTSGLNQISEQLYTDTTFELRCDGTDGSTDVLVDSKVVAVAEADPNAPVITSCIMDPANPVQAGVPMDFSVGYNDPNGDALGAEEWILYVFDSDLEPIHSSENPCSDDGNVAPFGESTVTCIEPGSMIEVWVRVTDTNGHTSSIYECILPASGTAANLTAANTSPTSGSSFTNQSDITFTGTLMNSDATTPSGENVWADVEIDWNQSNCSAASPEYVQNAGGPWTELADGANETLSAVVSNGALQVGDHCYRMIADRDDLVVESDNNDNGAPWTPFTVTNPTGDIYASGVGGTYNVVSGNSVVITWDSSDTASCDIPALGVSGGPTSNLGGQSSAPLTTETIFALSCIPQGGSSAELLDSVVVTIDLEPTLTTSASFARYNESIDLSWNAGTTATSSCSITRSGGVVVHNNLSTVSNPFPITVQSTDTYTITCGSYSDDVTIELIPAIWDS